MVKSEAAILHEAGTCPYTVLGVDRRDPLHKIRRAFHTIARFNHPDLLPRTCSSAVRAQRLEKMKLVNRCFDVLKCEGSRKEYDALSSRPRAPPPGRPRDSQGPMPFRDPPPPARTTALQKAEIRAEKAKAKWMAASLEAERREAMYKDAKDKLEAERNKPKAKAEAKEKAAAEARAAAQEAAEARARARAEAKAEKARAAAEAKAKARAEKAKAAAEAKAQARAEKAKAAAEAKAKARADAEAEKAAAEAKTVPDAKQTDSSERKCSDSSSDLDPI